MSKNNVEIQITPSIKVKKIKESQLPKGEMVRGIPLLTLIKPIQQLANGHYTLNNTSIRFEISKKEASIFFPSSQFNDFSPYLTQLLDLKKANQYVNETECKMCWGRGCVDCDFHGVTN